jgi:hypothetical protein
MLACLLQVFLFAVGASVLIQPGLFMLEQSKRLNLDNIFSAGYFNYRNLLVDTKSTSLYVGGRGHLFKLWLYNINDTSSSNLVSFKHSIN